MNTPSEKTQAKAAEYLLSGRIKVLHVDTDQPWLLAHAFSASSPGDPYIVKYNAVGWHCDCPARVQVCAHVLACQTITSFPEAYAAAQPSSVTFTQDKSIDEILGSL